MNEQLTMTLMQRLTALAIFEALEHFHGAQVTKARFAPIGAGYVLIRVVAFAPRPAA